VASMVERNVLLETMSASRSESTSCEARGQFAVGTPTPPVLIAGLLMPLFDFSSVVALKLFACVVRACPRGGPRACICCGASLCQRLLRCASERSALGFQTCKRSAFTVMRWRRKSGCTSPHTHSAALTRLVAWTRTYSR
jgi:hypothetical protein